MNPEHALHIRNPQQNNYAITSLENNPNNIEYKPYQEEVAPLRIFRQTANILQQSKESGHAAFEYNIRIHIFLSSDASLIVTNQSSTPGAPLDRCKLCRSSVEP